MTAYNPAATNFLVNAPPEPSRLSQYRTKMTDKTTRILPLDGVLGVLLHCASSAQLLESPTPARQSPPTAIGRLVFDDIACFGALELALCAISAILSSHADDVVTARNGADGAGAAFTVAAADLSA